VPRFASLEVQARTAATQALAGSVRSGASLAHALWLAEGDPSSVSVDMEGTAVAMAFGYPDEDSIDDTLVDYAGFALATAGGNAVFTKQTADGSSTIANCTVTYVPPAAANDAPDVQTNTSGC
jgi:MSHA pilin protein MshA